MALKLAIKFVVVWGFKIHVFKVNDVYFTLLSMSIDNLLFCLLSDQPFLLPPAATFGTASMSMPAGFGTPAPYNLPTSFSGSFQQSLVGASAVVLGSAPPCPLPLPAPN